MSIGICILCVVLCLILCRRTASSEKMLTYEKALEEGNWKFVNTLEKDFEAVDFLLNKLYVDCEEKSGIIANNNTVIYEQYVECSNIVNNLVILTKFEQKYASSPIYLSNFFVRKLAGFEKMKNIYNIYSVSVEKARYTVSEDILELIINIEKRIKTNFILVMQNNVVGLLMQYRNEKLMQFEKIQDVLADLENLSRRLYESV